jgi:hypothetical protein
MERTVVKSFMVIVRLPVFFKHRRREGSSSLFSVLKPEAKVCGVKSESG